MGQNPFFSQPDRKFFCSFVIRVHVPSRTCKCWLPGRAYADSCTSLPVVIQHPDNPDTRRMHFWSQLGHVPPSLSPASCQESTLYSSLDNDRQQCNKTRMQFTRGFSLAAERETLPLSPCSPACKVFIRHEDDKYFYHGHRGGSPMLLKAFLDRCVSQPDE